jgi:predicted amidohydrolase
MIRSMRLAAIQYRPPKGNPDQARKELLRLIDAAGREGADLIVCPELATTGYMWNSAQELVPFTESTRGPTFHMLAAAARRHSAWIVCGFAERFIHPPQRDQDKGRRMASLFNSAMVVMPEGQMATCYRKVCLYEADRSWANPGWRRPVCPTPLGKMVPAICMDINDPEFADFLRLTHPDIIAFCTNWIDEGQPVHPYWQQRLADWSGWLVAANSWGEDRGVQFCGRSAIMAPDGEVVAQAGTEGDEVLLVEVSKGPIEWMPPTPAEA